MAHFHTHFYSFLLLVTLFPSPQIQARLGTLYNELPKLPFQTPSPSPYINQVSLPPSGISPSPSPIFEVETSPSPTTTILEGGISEIPIEDDIAPTPLDAMDNAYGLYGSSDSSDEVFNKKSTNNVDGENDEEPDVHANDFNTESFKEVNSYNQNEYNNLPSYNDNFKNGENYNENNNNGGANYDSRGFNENVNGDGFGGRQGMSDTTFMENGKYYYGAQNGNNNQNDGYESVNGNNRGRYYGDRTKYEFDSMDEYEREQGYSNDQKYYVP